MIGYWIELVTVRISVGTLCCTALACAVWVALIVGEVRQVCHVPQGKWSVVQHVSLWPKNSPEWIDTSKCIRHFVACLHHMKWMLLGVLGGGHCRFVGLDKTSRSNAACQELCPSLITYFVLWE